MHVLSPMTKAPASLLSHSVSASSTKHQQQYTRVQLSWLISRSVWETRRDSKLQKDDLRAEGQLYTHVYILRLFGSSRSTAPLFLIRFRGKHRSLARDDCSIHWPAPLYTVLGKYLFSFYCLIVGDMHWDNVENRKILFGYRKRKIVYRVYVTIILYYIIVDEYYSKNTF